MFPLEHSCSGEAQCITGKVSKIVDGDTIKVDDKSIRFALTSTPEINDEREILAKGYVEKTCPVGSTVLVDEDDMQTDGSYGRIIGLIKCNGTSCDECFTGYRPGQLISCDKCGDEFCDSCIKNHKH